MHLGFAQLTLLTAAYAAKSSIWSKRPMSEKDKTSLQASLRRVFAFLSRMAEQLQIIVFFSVKVLYNIHNRNRKGAGIYGK